MSQAVRDAKHLAEPVANCISGSGDRGRGQWRVKWGVTVIPVGDAKHLAEPVANRISEGYFYEAGYGHERCGHRHHLLMYLEGCPLGPSDLDERRKAVARQEGSRPKYLLV
ncbi:MAG: hypothetical protein WCO83_06765 [Alphaproteobacteria bacterium]